MKKLGLLGGISWVSTVDYYKFINRGINEKLGGLNYANCLIYSFNYADIKKNNDNNDWDKTLEMLSEAALHLKAGGAEAIILCASTMHMVADKVAEKVGLPLINIASVTAEAISQLNLKKVGLLGTRFTMEQMFFKDKLTERGIESIIPDENDRNFIHQTIFDELGRGIFQEDTKQHYLNIINKLIDKGAEGIILGCTEIPSLVQQEDVKVPVFDTTLIHSQAAVSFALS